MSKEQKLDEILRAHDGNMYSRKARIADLLAWSQEPNPEQQAAMEERVRSVFEKHAVSDRWDFPLLQSEMLQAIRDQQSWCEHQDNPNDIRKENWKFCPICGAKRPDSSQESRGRDE